MLQSDTSTEAKPCIDGRSKQQFGFEYIRGIWDAYPTTPKFAYLNALASHDYSLNLAYQGLGAEAYDDYLSEFLTEMLAREDAKKTIIVLRSDHGLQGGPAPLDYNVQIEHMNPFNSFIVPDKFHGLSIETLYANQDRLNTGYDLYNTLRNAIDPHSNNESIPDWSHNLFQDVVSKERTCQDAMIPKEYCPCVQQRTDMMPYFYLDGAEKLDENPVRLIKVGGRFVADVQRWIGQEEIALKKKQRKNKQRGPGKSNIIKVKRKKRESTPRY